MKPEEILSASKLRLHPGARWCTTEKDYVVVSGPAGGDYLILQPREAKELRDGFTEPSTASEALVRLLNQHSSLSLRGYYDMVLRAHRAGALVDAATEPAEPPPDTWRWKLPAGPTWLAASVAAAASAVLLLIIPWPRTTSWLPLAAGWALACVLMSLGHVWAAGALAGAGLRVGRGRLALLAVFPHFAVRTGEAVLGGRTCEWTIAAARLAPVLVGALALGSFHSPLFPPVLAAVFLLLGPWESSPLMQGLTARFDEARFSIGERPVFETDEWTRWTYRWSRARSGFGRIRSLWWGLWPALALTGAAAYWPALVRRLERQAAAQRIDADAWRLAAAGAAVVALFLLAYGIRLAWQHLAMRRQWLSLPTPRQGGPARAPLAVGELRATLAQVPLFAGLDPAVLDAVGGAMAEVSHPAGATVFAENDPADAFYLVLAGDLEVSKLTPGGRKPKPVVIGRLGPGDCFGEIALLEDIARTATLRCAAPCRLGRLSREDFQRCLLANVGLEHIRRTLQAVGFLARFNLLAGASVGDLVGLARRCSWRTFAPGTMALRQRQPNGSFFLIFDGVFDVKLGDKLLRRMMPGDYFGEISLIEECEATADVIAVEESRCLVFNRADFLEIFARDYRIGLRVEGIAKERRAHLPPAKA